MNLKKYKIFALSGMLTIGALTAGAETIDCTAGELSELIGDNTSVTTLAVTGTVNAADLNFIASELQHLNALDLSGASVKAYNGNPLASGLTISAANEIPSYGLMGLKASTLILPEGITAIGECALAYSAISELTIPPTVTTIGNSAFTASALTKAVIPATVTSLGAGVFSDCASLTVATVSAQLDSISRNCFLNCAALTEVSLPASVVRIGDSAFAGTSALAEFTFPQRVLEIGSRAFYMSGITAVDLSRQIGVSLGAFAFARDLSLTSVALPSGASIGEGVFFDDASLKSISLPASVTEIPSFTFKGTTSVNPQEIITDGVTSIGDYALTGWTQVTDLKLPASVSYLGDNSMEGWTSLKSIDVQDHTEVPALGKNVWENVDQPEATVYVADQKMLDAFMGTPQWDKFKISMNSVGIDDITGDTTTTAIEYYFEGTTLVINSTGADITAVEIYSIDGRRLYYSRPATAIARVNTSAWTPGAIIVTSTLADGKHQVVKLILN